MILQLENRGDGNESRGGFSGRIRPRGTFVFLTLTLVVMAALGQTLAANININLGESTEFGQGFQAFTTCAGETPLTLRATTSFVNGGQSGQFYLKSLAVNGVPAQCNGYDLTIKAFGSGGGALALYGGNQSSAVAHVNGATFAKGPGTGYQVSGSNGSFTITFNEPVGVSGDIYKFTVETGEHTPLTCLNGGICSLGDTGPGGGTIFFASNSAFSVPGSECGDSCKYLEFAPKQWGVGIAVTSGETSGSANSWPTLRWCTGTGRSNYVTSLASTNESAMMTSTFGLGYRYTSEIAANCTSGAGKTVFDLTFGGKSDWFLPSFSEMHQLCKYIRGSTGIGTLTTPCSGGTMPALFETTHYWTSTESTESAGRGAWLFFLGTPDPDDDLKEIPGRALAIRAFSS